MVIQLSIHWSLISIRIQVKNAMNRINAADRENRSEFEAGIRIRIVAKARQKQKANAYRDKVLQIKEEIARGLESVDVLNRVGINSQALH
jgi:anti-sigma28 factor (negative regulator of flagellin synthesis)